MDTRNTRLSSFEHVELYSTDVMWTQSSLGILGCEEWSEVEKGTPKRVNDVRHDAFIALGNATILLTRGRRIPPHGEAHQPSEIRKLRRRMIGLWWRVTSRRKCGRTQRSKNPFARSWQE